MSEKPRHPKSLTAKALEIINHVANGPVMECFKFEKYDGFEIGIGFTVSDRVVRSIVVDEFSQRAEVRFENSEEIETHFKINRASYRPVKAELANEKEQAKNRTCTQATASQSQVVSKA